MAEQAMNAVTWWGRADLVLYVVGGKFCHTPAELLFPFLAEHNYLSSRLFKGFPRNAQVFTVGGSAICQQRHYCSWGIAF